MHHVGSTLGLMRLAMSAYKRRKVRQIFHFHKNCYAHTKVYILPLKTITHDQGLLSACALLLTKAGVAFISDKPGGRSREFPAPCTWAYSTTNSLIAGCDDCDLWFMIHDLWFFVTLVRSNQPLPHHQPPTASKQILLFSNTFVWKGHQFRTTLCGCSTLSASSMLDVVLCK